MHFLRGITLFLTKMRDEIMERGEGVGAYIKMYTT